MITYEWQNAEQTVVMSTDTETGQQWSIFISEDPSLHSVRCNEFLASGATAAPYVAPPEPEPLTTEQKFNCLLSDYGLTREEMIVALSAKKGD